MKLEAKSDQYTDISEPQARLAAAQQQQRQAVEDAIEDAKREQEEALQVNALS